MVTYISLKCKAQKNPGVLSHQMVETLYLHNPLNFTTLYVVLFVSPFLMTNYLNTLLICIAVLGGTYFLSQREVTIKDASSNPTQAGVVMNSISVQGDGKVFAQPDVFILGISISSVASTTAEAQEQTKTDAETITALAKSAGVAEKDIQTTEMSIYPEYDYSTNTQKIKGFRATHGLTLKIRDLKQVDTLIPQVTFSNNVQISSMSYDIDDKTDLYSEARKLGFAKAKQKAEELASLAGISLDKPLSISDQISYMPPYPMPMQANVYREEIAMDSVGSSPTINPGQLELSVTVNVVYGVK